MAAEFAPEATTIFSVHSLSVVEVPSLETTSVDLQTVQGVQLSWFVVEVNVLAPQAPHWRSDAAVPFVITFSLAWQVVQGVQLSWFVVEVNVLAPQAPH